MNLPPVVVRIPDGQQISIPAIEVPDRVDEQIQSWDCAFKDLETSDYVVGQVWGRVGPLYFPGHQVRGPDGPPDDGQRDSANAGELDWHDRQADRGQVQRLGRNPDSGE